MIIITSSDPSLAGYVSVTCGKYNFEPSCRHVLYAFTKSHNYRTYTTYISLLTRERTILLREKSHYSGAGTLELRFDDVATRRLAQDPEINMEVLIGGVSLGFTARPPPRPPSLPSSKYLYFLSKSFFSDSRTIIRPFLSIRDACMS